jgi:hypothetical protein
MAVIIAQETTKSSTPGTRGQKAVGDLKDKRLCLLPIAYCPGLK